MTDVVYHLTGIVHTYGEAPPVLEIPELTITGGMVTGMIGPNGSGKTTLLKVLSFIIQPDEGTVRFRGESSSPAQRRSVTYLPQTPYLLNRTVYKNVVYGLRLRGEKNDLDRKAEEALALVGLSGDGFRQRRADELSGGERQRVALAVRLALKPEVLLLDEPTANVDAESARLIKAAAQQAVEAWGTTVVVASHDLHWLYEICDCVLQIHQGRLWIAGDRNIMGGDWRPSGGGYCMKVLPDGQTLRVLPPTSSRASALVECRALLSGETAPGNTCRIETVISRLIMEKKTGKILLTLSAGNLVLNIRLAPERVAAEELYPGKELTVYYDPGQVMWI